MNNRLIAVDTFVDVHERAVAAWGSVGIKILRVETMNEAIARLSRGEEYLFAAINEDSIPDFMAQLPIMRDVTDVPIFVITSTYTTAKKAKVIGLGADVYDPFAELAIDNVHGALALLKSINRQSEKTKNPLSVLIGGDVVLSKLRRLVFVNDVEVKLPKKEFEVLKVLMEHSGCFLETAQLLRIVWGEEYSEKASNSLWRVISMIRSNLSEVSQGKEYIKAEREIGYRFSP